MTDQEMKERLLTVLETLPAEKVEAVLEFATSLQDKMETQPPAADADLDDWDRAVIAAEEYWFSLPEAERHAYTGKVVAVVKGKILAVDTGLAQLQARIRAEYLDTPVLYIEGEAEQFPEIRILSPKLRLVG
jgi:hypothetical protein